MSPADRLDTPYGADHLDDLIERIAAADRDAFVELFAFFAPRLKGQLMRQGESPAQAETLAIEVMTTAWRGAIGFDRGRDTAAAWIFRILRNRRLEAPQPARASSPEPVRRPRVRPLPLSAPRPTPLRRVRAG
jgi:RNA polymerase sigma-70 factor (ECF subfamily)